MTNANSEQRDSLFRILCCDERKGCGYCTRWAVLFLFFFSFPIFSQTITGVTGDTVTLDLGKKDGIKPGMTAFVFDEVEVSGQSLEIKVAKIIVMVIHLNRSRWKVLEKTEMLAPGMHVVLDKSISQKVGGRQRQKTGTNVKQKEKTDSDAGNFVILRLRKAKKYMDSNNFSAAIREIQAVLKVEPGNLLAKKWLETLRLKQRRFEMKMKIHQRKLKLFPNYDYAVQAGEACVQSGDFALGLNYFNQILQKIPDDINVLRNALFCCEKLGNWQAVGKRAESLAGMLDKGPDKKKAFEKSVLGYKKSGDYFSAMRVIKKMLEIWPDDPNLILEKADVLAKNGSTDEARRILRDILRRFPRNNGAREMWRRLLPVYFVNEIGMKFLLIRHGKFQMGVNSGYQDSIPLHTVVIPHDFYMGETEVTQAQWSRIMARNPSERRGGDLPVHGVTWEDAVQFTRILSERTGKRYRLPTEAEWEYACRAGTVGDFSGGGNGDQLEKYAWYKRNAKNHVHGVGLKLPNHWGLFDMLGNAWEWCQDWYASDYYRNSPGKDPSGPLSGVERVCRGGAWNEKALVCTPVFRAKMRPEKVSNVLGFRVVFVISDSF